MNGQIITNTAIGQLLNAHFKSINTPPTKMQVGNSTTTPTVSDTALGNKIPVNWTVVDAMDAATSWVAGTDSTTALDTTTFKEGTGSIELGKTGTTGITASMAKTESSADFTSKNLWFWTYVPSTSILATTAIEARYGSSSANYYQYQIPLTSVSAGWNYYTFTTTTATTTVGTPTVTACTYLSFLYYTPTSGTTSGTTPLLFDDVKLSTSSNYDISLVAGYPSVDTTTLQAVTESTLTTTMANGSSITELGSLDASNNLQSHAVFDAESKSATDIFYFVETTKIRNQS